MLSTLHDSGKVIRISDANFMLGLFFFWDLVLCSVSRASQSFLGIGVGEWGEEEGNDKAV